MYYMNKTTFADQSYISHVSVIRPKFRHVKLNDPRFIMFPYDTETNTKPKPNSIFISLAISNKKFNT